jgi:acetyl esterase/lipase
MIAGIALPVCGEETAPKIIPDVVYGHKDGLAMTMDIYYPTSSPNGAAVVFMVSGGWYSKWAPPESMLPIFQPYLDAGFTMMAVRHGSSPRYSIPEAVSDVRQAIRFIHIHAKDWSVEPTRLGVLGMSAGGHLALMLGTTGEDAASEKPTNVDHASSRVRAVVALVPPTDLRVAVWEAPESLPAYRAFPALDLSLDKAKEYSPVVHVTKDDAPALVIMGGDDELVPPRHGEWIDAAYQKEQVPHKLVIFEGEGHGLGMNNEENRQRLNRETVEWFKNHLTQ